MTVKKASATKPKAEPKPVDPDGLANRLQLIATTISNVSEKPRGVFLIGDRSLIAYGNDEYTTSIISQSEVARFRSMATALGFEEMGLAVETLHGSTWVLALKSPFATTPLGPDASAVPALEELLEHAFTLALGEHGERVDAAVK